MLEELEKPVTVTPRDDRAALESDPGRSERSRADFVEHGELTRRRQASA